MATAAFGVTRESSVPVPTHEVEPEPFELVDDLYLSRRLVLIGCDPRHYRGWTEPKESRESADVDDGRNWRYGL